MTKFLALLLTFALGVFTFNLLGTQRIAVPELLPVEKAIKTSDSKIKLISTEKSELSIITKKPEKLQLFFDSFDMNKDNEETKYQGYSGWFTPDNFKGMKEVWTISLHRSNENSKNAKLVWSAMVLTQYPDGSSNDDADFHSIQIKTEGDYLSFKTNKFRGIEYKFDGKFFKNGKEFTNDEKVLRGTLQKIVKGKLVAKFTANFVYYEPHCFH